MKEGTVWKILSGAALLALGALGAVLLWRGIPSPAWSAAGENPGPVVVIDAGHGGADGGAVAADGTAESGLNLAVAQRLEALLALCGQETLMLRPGEESLHDPEAATLREKKVSDIHNRVDRVNATPNPRLISIHQNHFEQSRYRGAQVFFAGGPLGEPWARRTQENFKKCLDPANTRECKPAPRSVYLMEHVTCPALLVECGFLSNPEEAALLKTPGYQTQLALVIGGSYLQSRS